MKRHPSSGHLLLLVVCPCLLLWLFSGLPPSSGVLRFVSSDGCASPQPGQESEALIERAYSRLAYYSSTTAAPLAFEISDFSWIDRNRFDEVAYLEVAELHEGARIRVEPVTRSRRAESQKKEAGASQLERAYFAHWEEAPPDPREEVLATKTLQEVFDLSASAEPGLRRAEAVTAYRVQARLQGQSREYQALFVWLSAPAPDGSCFSVLDEVTDQVAKAYREEVPLARKADMYRQPR